ncbi:MAG TPA: carboxylesterase family protein [Allosphingosinicella sp.]|jgi:para-nitrobenzyl esterase
MTILLRLLMSATLAIAAFSAAPALSQASTTISTDLGPVSGVEHGQTVAFLGIPYAAAPVGSLRWAPPQRPMRWTTPLKANAFASSCAQNSDLGVFGRAGGSEDCLYLNVVASRSAQPDGAKRPVLVWIHGGSLYVGAGSDHDPTKLAVDGGAVVVTFNYRLGLFGFFAHPDIRHSQGVANYGLMDQQAALDWVQRNIANFGGDPHNVTIAGESSGGNSVLSHLVSPRSAGKFQYAISMSGGVVGSRHPNFGSPRPLRDAEQIGISFARAVGCERQSVSCLRQLSAKQVLDAQTPFLINQAIIDGTIMPRSHGEAFQSGRFNRVPVINGHNRDEGTFFAALREVALGKAMTEADYATAILSFYSTGIGPSILREYSPDKYASPSEAYAAAVGDGLIACSGYVVDRWLSRWTPVYAYEFTDRTAPSYVAPTTFPLLAAHTFELPYLFPGFRGGAGEEVSLNPLQMKLFDTMVRYWTTASKARDRESEWPRYNPAKNNVMALGLPSARMISGQFALEHKCAFWEKLGIYGS